jgi:Trypsin-like peptidase domain
MLFGAVALMLTACGGSSGTTGNGDEATTTDERPPLDAKELLASVRPSVGLVTTPVSQGSGVLVEGGYLVTNAHVVDPYSSADVTFEGDATIEDVPVVGIDPFADVALLGPITLDRDPLTIAPKVALEQGDQVYLVGYPGEFDTAPEVTISSGLVSRVRDYEPFGQTYIQTDAAIGGGQSGGALIDATGSVVGISGLSFADEFALALSGRDTLHSIDAISAGETPEYHPFTSTPAITSGMASVRDRADGALLLLGSAPEERTLRLTVPDDSEPTIQVSDLAGDLFSVNQRLVDVALQADPSLQPTDIGDLLTAVEPGVYEVQIPADADVTIALGSTRPEGATISFGSSLPVVLNQDTDDHAPLAPGDAVSGVIDAFELRDEYELPLAEGQTVRIRVSAAGGDALFAVLGEGDDPIDAEPVDDSEVGLTGHDAEDTFTATTAGTYRVIVGVNDPFVTGYRLEVQPA